MTNSPEPHLSDRRPGRTEESRYGTLIRRAAAGDQDALEALLLESQAVAYRFGLLVCGRTEDAEDVMQEALLKTYRYAGRMHAPDAFRTWLYRTVRNACLMKRRRRADQPAKMLSLDELMPAPHRDRRIDVADSAPGPHEQTLNRALARRLRVALAGLPPSYRMLVFLRDMEGLSTREAAKVLGISEANVKTRLHRARLFLRQRLEEGA